MIEPHNSLSDLPAEMISRLDAVCLQYELMLNNGEQASVEDLIAKNPHLPADILRTELELVRREILKDSGVQSPPIGDAAAGTADTPPPPFQPRRVKPQRSAAAPGRGVAAGAPAGVSGSSPADSKTPPFFTHTDAGGDGSGGTGMSPPPPGAMLGPYEIESQLDRGGMGIVYRAIDLRLRRDVAIKFLASHFAHQPDLVSRFDRENRAVAAIRHPNIVELFDVGRHNGLPYAVMEFLRGETLATFIRRGPMGHVLVRRIASQIASALATAHSAGVIHRDLKPGNVMLLRQSGGEIVSLSSGDEPSAPPQPKVELKLFDFGLSRLDESTPDQANDKSDLGSNAPSSGSAISGVMADEKPGDDRTVQGTVMGTPGYMAPEQIHGDLATPAVDLFALGAILYECWTGRRAFDGKTRDERFAATMADRPEIDEARRQADPTLAKIIDSCLEKRVSRRPPSAAIIVEDLQRTDSEVLLRLSEGNGRGGHGTGMRRRHWLQAAGGLAAAGALGVAGTSAVALYRNPRAFRGSVDGVNRLAVLSFDSNDTPDGELNAIQPLGQLSLGRKISTLLVNELSRLPDISVSAFRAVRADSREQYIATAAELGVDTLLDGKVEIEKRGDKDFLRWDLKLIDAVSGDQIWGGTKTTTAADNLLAQTGIAQGIAEVIGRQLVPTQDRPDPPSSDSFYCLIRGEARRDYDSTMSLRMARACFERASKEDPSFAEPIGGLAMVSMELAERANTAEDASKMVTAARLAMVKVFELDRSNIDGLLAGVRLTWQMRSRFEEAETILSDLATRHSSNPEVLHHWGRFLLVTGRNDEAIARFREASVLDPFSVLYGVDLAYARWVAGDAERAVEDIEAAQSRRKHDWYTGLLIDIAEQRSDFARAASLDPRIDPVASTSEAFYYPDRRNRLDAMPYGPFGRICNELIWQSRRSSNAAASQLSETLNPLPPMAVFLLATHPALRPLRGISRVKELLPA